jgi:hypothetical protein
MALNYRTGQIRTASGGSNDLKSAGVQRIGPSRRVRTPELYFFFLRFGKSAGVVLLSIFELSVY